MTNAAVSRVNVERSERRTSKAARGVFFFQNPFGTNHRAKPGKINS